MTLTILVPKDVEIKISPGDADNGLAEVDKMLRQQLLYASVYTL